ncbi:hypothetical protein ACIBUY_28135 [Streptomyces sp. NPDC050085]|uniref:SCO3933 family regulatory protein n=1 Tax=Streptomyces sp. NPDC050085 TaxID=3365600 RepID=UPI0037A74910
MAVIRVATPETTSFLTGTAAVPKIKNPETGEIAVDRETNETLYVLSVMQMEDGRAELLKITLPASGLPEGLMPGMAVRPVELVAIPWARVFNGNLSDGIAYRVKRLELVQPASTAVPGGGAEAAVGSSKKAA